MLRIRGERYWTNADYTNEDRARISKQNVEVVRRGFDDMNRVGISNVNLLLYFHPDVEYLPLRSATEGAYRGIAGIERFTTDTEEVFEMFEPHYEFLDLGERVLAWV